ncbi:MAG TPA: GPP34 family phosphoprotein [Dokdonella sp.]|uniref:GPP34 family phosphoprotein n=1 Tax=Dokdonella sp. TaxID=2291710 RepID=UPI002D7FB9DE|nr:GPP34 family phosphoprotein [Dokdonella sp.]HET9034439.1 GPP34 family phosphoprotein [Dokdonella sp.]
MLIAEQLMLLCIDPKSGDFDASRSHADANLLCAAALILDLFEQRRLRYQGKHLVIEPLLPTTHPQLAAAAQILAGPVGGLPASAAVELLVGRLNPTSFNLLESLFRRDVLHRVRESWLPWSKLHFPLRSIQARNEASTQLRNAAVADHGSLRGMGLLMLTDLAGQLEHNLIGDTHEAAMSRLLRLRGSRSVVDAEHDLLVDLRDALMA